MMWRSRWEDDGCAARGRGRHELFFFAPLKFQISLIHAQGSQGEGWEEKMWESGMDTDTRGRSLFMGN